LADRRLTFDNPPPFSRPESEAVLFGDDAEAAADQLVAITLSGADRSWVQSHCLRLSVHPLPNLRRLAGVCLGHLARLHGELDREQALVILGRLKKDADPYVRAALDDVVSDVVRFTGWMPTIEA
jgi:hypothetical protein